MWAALSRRPNLYSRQLNPQTPHEDGEGGGEGGGDDGEFIGPSTPVAPELGGFTLHTHFAVIRGFVHHLLYQMGYGKPQEIRSPSHRTCSTPYRRDGPRRWLAMLLRSATDWVVAIVLPAAAGGAATVT